MKMLRRLARILTKVLIVTSCLPAVSEESWQYFGGNSFEEQSNGVYAAIMEYDRNSLKIKSAPGISKDGIYVKSRMVVFDKKGISEAPGNNDEFIVFCKANSWKADKQSYYVNLRQMGALAFPEGFADYLCLRKRSGLLR
jgi:hypothetical protein